MLLLMRRMSETIRINGKVTLEITAIGSDSVTFLIEGTSTNCEVETCPSSASLQDEFVNLDEEQNTMMQTETEISK